VAEAEEKTATRHVHEELISSLSHGFRQRVGVAQALVHKPKLLILDEPTSGLDPIATRSLNELLLEMVQGGTTVLLSSHLLDQVQKLCGRMAIISRGRLAAVGTLDELRARATAESSLEDIFFAVAGGAATTAAP
jgi:ABC-2 type transport system ATP-binding protein